MYLEIQHSIINGLGGTGALLEAETTPPSFGLSLPPDLDRPIVRGSAENSTIQPTISDQAWPARDRRPPSHLEDYFCYSTHVKDPALASSLPSSSSGNAYPLTQYITCENFSVGHRACLLYTSDAADE